MPRLRITSGLSLLALAIGVAGTGWLSAQASRGLPARTATARIGARHARPVPHHVARRFVPPQLASAVRSSPPGLDSRSAPAAAAGLVPLAMPDEATPPWQALRGHLDGQLLLHIELDGRGRVRLARIGRSSGDSQLDARALRSVRGWRFAVPPGHPDGIGGDLPMRFSSAPDLARLR